MAEGLRILGGMFTGGFMSTIELSSCSSDGLGVSVRAGGAWTGGWAWVIRF